jgi:peptidoglycan hydrolase CwlO-like protein
MKRKILISFIFVFVIFIAIFEYVFVSKTLLAFKSNASELTTLLETTTTQTQNDDLKTLAKNVQEKWEKKENYLCIFIYHQEIKEIGDQISKIAALIDGDSFDDAKVEVHQLTYLLGTFKDLYSFNFFNIL